MKFRPILPNDYEQLASFWKQHYALKLHKGDDKETITRLLERNTGLSTIAEEDGVVIGTCVGTFDGRKGYIQKVAVSKELRGKGLGIKLVQETVKKILEAGAFQVQVNCGEDLVSFYRKTGFEVNPVVAMKIKKQIQG